MLQLQQLLFCIRSTIHVIHYRGERSLIKTDEILVVEAKVNDVALDELITRYRSFVKKWVKKYLYMYKYGLDSDDLEQIAMMALTKSFKTYNADKGASLKTYAYSVVRHAMLNEIRHQEIKLGDGICYIEDIFSELEVLPSDLIADLNEESRPDASLKRKEEKTISKQVYRCSSAKDISIAELLCHGYSRKEIAVLLNIPVREVYNRIYRMKQKSKSDIDSKK